MFTPTSPPTLTSVAELETVKFLTSTSLTIELLSIVPTIPPKLLISSTISFEKLTTILEISELEFAVVENIRPATAPTFVALIIVVTSSSVTLVTVLLSKYVNNPASEPFPPLINFKPVIV